MDKKRNNLLEKIAYGLIVAVVVLVAGLTASSILKLPGRWQLFTVQSGSMTPAIKKGSIVIVQPAAEYQPGEVITFIDPDTPKNSITHRLIEEKDDNGRVTFVTKGDANEAPDNKEVRQDWVLGKVILTVPFLGFPVAFAKTLPGLIILIIVPAVVIIYSEILVIQREIKKMRHEKKS